jgi:hypothetical protein
LEEERVAVSALQRKSAMRSVLRCIPFVLLGFLLVLPVLGADDNTKKADTPKKADPQKGNPKKNPDKEKDKETEKWKKFKEVVVKVVDVNEAKKWLRGELDLGKEKPHVEWNAIDSVKVRRVNPPIQFDDKGRVKKYTKKELKELKGEDKLPGYAAEFSDIKTGQYVKVTLVVKKGARVPIKKKGKDVDPEALKEARPQMSMIIIVAEPRN